ncbi:NAD-dependent epimerase/dehydratase family protein [Deinococcus koreensis]|nr:NAD-dependent epimerase/dehydratase family protein [Deinococcus koreensis]
MSMRLPLDAKIYVAGHDCPLGQMLCRKLHTSGYQQVITRTGQELNLRSQLDVNLFFEQELPDYVFVVTEETAEQVDQLTHPAEHLYSRLLGLSNVIHASYVYEVRKLLNIACFSGDQGADGAWNLTAESLSSGESLPAGALLQLVALGLCDRYRQQYSCDFISAQFFLESGDVAVAREPAAPGIMIQSTDSSSGGGVYRAFAESGDQLYSLNPTDACLFLMEHFSSAGAISIRSRADEYASP